jgi:hypothetical protein
VRESFAPYYDLFVPTLKAIIQRAKDKHYRLLRGRAMDCLCTIGSGVGRERFQHDAVEVMTEMLSTQIIEADDPQLMYLETGFVMMAEVIGQEFVQFLPTVLQPTLQRAALKPDAAEVDPEAQLKEGWQMMIVGDQTFSVHTEQLESKASALAILEAYAIALEGGFIQFALPVAQVAVAELTCYFYERVRKSAYSILPHLIACTKAGTADPAADKTIVPRLWQYIFDALMAALPKEPDNDVLAEALESFYSCVSLLDKPSLSAEQLSVTAKVLHGLFEEWCAEKQKIEQQKEEEDEVDEETTAADCEAAEEGTALDSVAANIADAIERIVELHHDAFVPAFQEFLAEFTFGLLAPERLVLERQYALCILDVVMQHSKVAARMYVQRFLPFMLQYATAPEAGLRQSACYGLGVTAVTLGDEFAPAINEVLVKLKQVAGAQEAFAPENVHATENAISAIGKIIDTQANSISIVDTIRFWVSLLPLRNDDSEAKINHELLCTFTERYPTIVLG